MWTWKIAVLIQRIHGAWNGIVQTLGKASSNMEPLYSTVQSKELSMHNQAPSWECLGPWLEPYFIQSMELCGGVAEKLTESILYCLWMHFWTALPSSELGVVSFFGNCPDNPRLFPSMDVGLTVSRGLQAQSKGSLAHKESESKSIHTCCMHARYTCGQKEPMSTMAG